MKQIHAKRTFAFLMALTLCTGALAGCGDTDSSSTAETTAATTTTTAESSSAAESTSDSSSDEEAVEEGIEDTDEETTDPGEDIDIDEYIANVLDDGTEKDEEVTPVTDEDTAEDDMNRGNSMLSSNSPFVEYTRISPNRSVPRNHKIDTITIHCMAGQFSIETCGNVFASSKAQASSNYGVDKDGRIGLYVPESDRSWCSSNRENDNRAVTIEVASDSYAPYAVSDKAYEATIRLVADICRRNGIKKLVWSTDKNERINHTNGANMTVHRDFANKACPGEYLYSRMGDIADQVNKIISGDIAEFENAEVPFKVTLAADSVSLIKDPGNDNTIVKNITRLSSSNKKYIYTVSEIKKVDDVLYGKLKSGSGWFDLSSAKLKK